MVAPTPTHVYILGYSDGVVKVGRTSNPGQRYAALSTEGRRRGAHVTAHWVKPVADPVDVEALLRLLGRRHLQKAWGGEYFRGDHGGFVDLVEVQLTTWGVENFRPEITERLEAERANNPLMALFMGKAS